MGLSGDTSNTSMVPISFSRAMVMEVIIADTSIKISVMTPGTKLKTPFCSGLYRMRDCTFMTGATDVAPADCNLFR